MQRRDILKSSALMLGYAVTGGTALAVLNGCKADTSDGWQPITLTAEQVQMLAEVAESIIPTTDTPGAKTAMVHRYIDEAISNNFTDGERERFFADLPQVDSQSQAIGKANFVDLSQKQKDAVLTVLASEAKEVHKANEANDTEEPHIFTTLRELTATGYFTSELVATEVLVYDPVPGPYKGCIPVSDVGGTYALW